MKIKKCFLTFGVFLICFSLLAKEPVPSPFYMSKKDYIEKSGKYWQAKRLQEELKLKRQKIEAITKGVFGFLMVGGGVTLITLGAKEIDKAVNIEGNDEFTRLVRQVVAKSAVTGSVELSLGIPLFFGGLFTLAKTLRDIKLVKAYKKRIDIYRKKEKLKTLSNGSASYDFKNKTIGFTYRLNF